MKINSSFWSLNEDRAQPEFKTQVAESIYNAKNPATRMYFQKNAIPYWALGNLIFFILLSYERLHTLFGGILWLLEFVIMLSCTVQIFVGNRLFRLPVRISVTAFMILVFFVWTYFTSFMANKDIGRTMADTVTWSGKWIVFYLLAAVSLDQATYCTARLRQLFKIGYVFFGFCSATLGILQWLGVGFAQQLALKTFVYEGSVRATGLSDYPSQLAFQCFIAMAIIIAPVVRRSLTAVEWVGFGYFALAIIAAQYRTMYFSGIGVAFTCIVLFEFSRNKINAIAIVMSMIVFVGALFALFPKRLSYAVTLSKDNVSIQVRQNGYQQLTPIMELRPVTGLGTDTTLFLGYQGTEDKWSREITDSLYVTITACYGIVGICFFAITMISMLGGGLSRYLTAPDHAKEMAFICILLMISMLVLSSTGNSLVYRSVGTSIAVAFGLGGLTWREELNQKPFWLMIRDTFDFLRKGNTAKPVASRI